MFFNGLDKESIVLYAARASRVENQDAIDACMVGMLADPKEVSMELLYYVLKNQLIVAPSNLLT